MGLAEILAEDGVLACAGMQSKQQVFGELATCAASLTGLNRSDILATITNREALGSTGLGNGIAVPHGKTAGIRKVTAVFARLDHAVDWDAVDDQPVDLVMLLLSPAGAGADHLKALSRVARLLRTEAVVDQLRQTSDTAQLYAILSNPTQATYAA